MAETQKSGRFSAVMNGLATTIPEFFYVTILRFKPLKSLVNGIILRVLPRSVKYGDAVVVLNPADPVVSGALTFRVYERNEITFFRRMCGPGMTVLDVGANVGFYTALACHQVGPQGRVFSIEPEPTCFSYLKKTIAANQATNVQCFQVAGADVNGKRLLFRSESNTGDNRLYEPEKGWASVEVQTMVLDDLLAGQGVAEIDILKIDVQGAEGLVLAGLEQTLRRSQSLMMLSEFWPYGLRRAGTDPLELLQRLVDFGLQLYELRGGHALAALTDPAGLIERHPGRKYTNIVGVKGARFAAALASL